MEQNGQKAFCGKKPDHSICVDFFIKRSDTRVIITPATKYLKFCHSGESRNLLKRLDAGSSPA